MLVCSIVKAGVGIAFTRTQDALFVETDWTLAIALIHDRLTRARNRRRSKPVDEQ